eukprot:m.173503 g.173503  ORF g.173503 m.173503 type:complete len:705 (+) comp14850_c0_seq3:194-2308(+)
MGCTSSKDSEEAYEEGKDPQEGNGASSDMDELIRLKMVADAEHETFEAMEEADSGWDGEGTANITISISDEDPLMGTKSRPSIADLDNLPERKSPAEEAAEAEAERARAEAAATKRAAEAEVAAAKAAADEAESARTAALAEVAEAKAMAERAKAEKAKAEAEAAEAKAQLEKIEAEKAAALAEAAQAASEKAAAEQTATELAEAAAKEKAAAEEAAAGQKAAEAEAVQAKAQAEKLAEEKKAAELEAARAKAAAEEAAASKAAAAKAAAESAAAAAAEKAAAEKADAERRAAEKAAAESAAAEKAAAEKVAAAATEDKLAASQAAKADRKKDADAAKERMTAEVSGLRKREKSLYNRKQASKFVTGLAEKQNLFDNHVDVMSVPPLVQRQSSRDKLRGRKASTSKLSVVPVGGAAADPPAEGGLAPLVAKAAAAPRGGPSAKKSMRKSIRNMFKSKRSRRPKKASSTASDTGPKQGLEPAMRKPGSVTVADIDAGLPENDEYERLDPRAIEAARWTDKSIQQLIEEIKKHGEVTPAGQVALTFGKLFEETANIFDALVGIIKTAKKYGVLHCNKDQLWQGQDDNEVITLIRDTHPGVVINRRRNNQLKGASGAKTKGFGGSAMSGGVNPSCTVCSKTVYQTEYVGASDKAFHKNCFRCMDKSCNRVLKSSDYCNVDDKFYCPPCYKRLVMAAGGAGKETTLGT